MKSKLGFFAAISFLLSVPFALIAQMIFGGNRAETMIHFLCGAGFVLSSIAMFDFKLPRWITWIGSLSTSAVGIIFLIQGMSNLMPNNDGLFYLAFQVLGQGLESWLIDLFILWFIAMLFMDSQGRTRVFGFIVLSTVVILEVYRIGVTFMGGTTPGALKLVYFLAIIWFLLESAKKIQTQVQVSKPVGIHP